MRRDTTINGKPVTEVEKELRRPFPKEVMKTTDEGFLYAPIEFYENRLNEVIGALNYNQTIVDSNMIEVCGKYVITATVLRNL